MENENAATAAAEVQQPVEQATSGEQAQEFAGDPNATERPAAPTPVEEPAPTAEAEQAPAAEVEQPAPAPEQEPAPAPVPTMTVDEINTEIARVTRENMDGLRSDVLAFFTKRVEPMEDSLKEMAGQLDALSARVDNHDAAAPDSIAQALSDVKDLSKQVADISAKLKHWI